MAAFSWFKMARMEVCAEVALSEAAAAATAEPWALDAAAVALTTAEAMSVAFCWLARNCAWASDWAAALSACWAADRSWSAWALRAAT